MSKLTKSAVDKHDEGILWDSELRGFGARATKTGKTFILKYRFEGKQRFYSIGRYGQGWTVDSARKKAHELLGQIASGIDPADKKALKGREASLEAVMKEFVTNHVRRKLKPKTVHSYERIIGRFILPELGTMKLSQIGHREIEGFHQRYAGSPRQANLSVAIISKFFNWAAGQGYREGQANPCAHIAKYPERKVERFLSVEEIQRLGSALTEAEQSQSENPYAIAAIRLLLFTGARLSEILTAKWELVDWERGVLRLEDRKANDKAILLTPPAIDLLKALPRTHGNPYIIVGAVEGQHLINLQKPWRRLRKAAALDDVRLHDLRHSFASIGAGEGHSLLIIGRLLGHSQAATTQRYAHLADDPIRQAGDAISAKIAAALSPDKHPDLGEMQNGGEVGD